MQYPKHEVSKTSANKVIFIEWNPRMDLLATVFKNGALTCSRLLSLQKVWHKESIGKVISIAWRPDGKVLAIGGYNDKTKENICTLHDVENGKQIFSITKECLITSVAWFQHCPTSEGSKQREDLIKTKKILPGLSANETFSHQLAHEQTQLNILVISTSDGKISFYALGLFYLGAILICNDNVESKIIGTHMSGCLKYITATILTKHPNNCSTSIKVIKLNLFQKRSSEILRVSKMYARITDELEYLDDTISAITTSWADVLAGLDNKLSSYCSRKKQSNNGGYTFLSADELLQLLVIGFPSDNLEKFLTDMSDKGLKKLNNAIEQTCIRVQNLIVKNAQKCCYHLHNDLNLLKGMALWRDRFSDVGLDDKFIIEAMRSVGALMLKLTELQQVIDHSMKSTKSFFRWLISIACRLSGEPNNSIVQNEVNKTTQQDIQLVTDFILENFDYNSVMDELGTTNLSNHSEVNTTNGESDIWSNRPTCSNFTLGQVGQYLKNEPLSRLKYSFLKPESNFWIEFFKNRVETTKAQCLEEDGSSVLLFYPHNENTSLIQEHKGTCKTVDSAFKSVANNVTTLLSDSDSFIYLRDFLKNAPVDRVRVDTEITTLHHYTLFQMKPESIQYLVSQSLEDKSFMLVSLEFQLKTEGSRKLLTADSCFFDSKDTQKSLMFLLVDPTQGDTIIVNVDLNKIMDLSKATSRNSKEVAKVFRTNESIDKFSSHLTLKLDLETEPAIDRIHECEMMVKRVRNTVGKDMFASSGRGVIAFTSNGNKRLHLYELASDPDLVDDDIEGEEKVDESLIDTDQVG